MIETLLILALVALAICGLQAAVTITTSVVTTMTSAGDSGSGLGITGSRVDTADDGIMANIDVPAATSNKQITMAFSPTTLKHITILSNKNVTIYVNAASGGSPDQIIAIKANVPFTWSSQSGEPYPFIDSGDGTSLTVANLYITNALTGSPANDAVVKFRGCKDITP